MRLTIPYRVCISKVVDLAWEGSIITEATPSSFSIVAPLNCIRIYCVKTKCLKKYSQNKKKCQLESFWLLNKFEKLKGVNV